MLLLLLNTFIYIFFIDKLITIGIVVEFYVIQRKKLYQALFENLGGYVRLLLADLSIVTISHYNILHYN